MRETGKYREGREGEGEGEKTLLMSRYTRHYCRWSDFFLNDIVVFEAEKRKVYRCLEKKAKRSLSTARHWLRCSRSLQCFLYPCTNTVAIKRDASLECTNSSSTNVYMFIIWFDKLQ